MAPQTPANVQPAAARNHDIQKKQRGRLALGIGNHAQRVGKGAHRESRRLQVVPDEPLNIKVVFKDEYGLVQIFLSTGR